MSHFLTSKIDLHEKIDDLSATDFFFAKTETLFIDFPTLCIMS